jgi:hypothetical protein
MNRLTNSILGLILIGCGVDGFLKWGMRGGLGVTALGTVSAGFLYLGRKAVDNFRYY